MDYVQEALHIVEAAKTEDVMMRIAGACAVSLLCRHVDFYMRLNRRVTDIDLIALGRDRAKIPKLLQRVGYLPHEQFNLYHGLQRHIYSHRSSPEDRVDVFFDTLTFCHTIDFRNRLVVEYPTIPLAELVLEKNQVVKITEKDLKDTVALFKAYPVGDGDSGMINGKHIAKILSRDWGFWYTVVSNLGNAQVFLDQLDGPNAEEKAQVKDRLTEALTMIDEEPKSLTWKMRARVGTRKKWYSEVDEADSAPPKLENV